MPDCHLVGGAIPGLFDVCIGMVEGRAMTVHADCYDREDVNDAAKKARKVIIAYRDRCPCAAPACCDHCIHADAALDDLVDYE